MAIGIACIIIRIAIIIIASVYNSDSEPPKKDTLKEDKLLTKENLLYTKISSKEELRSPMHGPLFGR